MKLKYKAALRRRAEPRPREKRADAHPVSRAARMLALAHYVEGLVEGSQVKGYAEAARQLGITRARMSQVMNLLNLSVLVQEELLLGTVHHSERRLRALVTNAEWVDNARSDHGSSSAVEPPTGG